MTEQTELYEKRASLHEIINEIFEIEGYKRIKKANIFDREFQIMQIQSKIIRVLMRLSKAIDRTSLTVGIIFLLTLLCCVAIGLSSLYTDVVILEFRSYQAGIWIPILLLVSSLYLYVFLSWYDKLTTSYSCTGADGPIYKAEYFDGLSLLCSITDSCALKIRKTDKTFGYFTGEISSNETVQEIKIFFESV